MPVSAGTSFEVGSIYLPVRLRDPTIDFGDECGLMRMLGLLHDKGADRPDGKAAIQPGVLEDEEEKNARRTSVPARTMSPQSREAESARRASR
jgi:hypothetical protein